MFEKEAEDFADSKGSFWRQGRTCIDSVRQAFQKGAEFGYNKANECNTETPSSSVGNKDLLLRVAKDDFDVGYYHIEKKRFYTNDGREVTPLAWKEIRYPQENE